MDRRTFIAGASASRILGANDRIRTGLIGSGGRGRYVAEQFREVGADVMAVADIYEPNLQAGLKSASTGAKGYDDYRRLLDDKSLDAVLIATPDHWHAPMVIDAVRAGKDVYVEKPMAHEIHEGFEVVDAVRATKRVVQVGTQRRSFDIFLEAKAIMDSGQLGDVRLVTSWWMNHTTTLSDRHFQGRIDWKQFLGKAPKCEMSAHRFFNWYYYWDYSGGLLIGQAAHIVDAIQWFMNSKSPLAVTCSGGKPNLAGAQVTDTATISIEYPENYFANFTLGYKAMRYRGCNDQMKQFHGSKARFDVGREGYALYPESSAVEMKASVQKKEPGSFDRATRMHIRNFFDCIRSRKEPNAPVEAGQATNIALAMTMQSLRAGRRLRWNAARRAVEG